MRVLFVFLLLFVVSGCYYHIPHETFTPIYQSRVINDEVEVYFRIWPSKSRLGGWPYKRTGPYTIHVSVLTLKGVKVRQPENYRYVVVHSLVVADKLQGKRFDLITGEQKIPFEQYGDQRIRARFISEREEFKTPYFSPKFADDQELTLNLDISVVMASGTVRKQIETKHKAARFVHSGYMY